MGSNSYAKIIINPTAGTGGTGRKWPRIEAALRKAGLLFDTVRTEGKGHAIELAREAALEGYEMVVAAGGDGTLNEVVNGLVDSGCGAETTMGILNTGTGCDFARFLKVPRDPKKACKRLLNPHKVLADVGVVEFGNGDRLERRIFMGTAGLGFDGEVVETATKSPRIIHGNIPYFFGVLQSLGTWRNKEVHIEVDDESIVTRIWSIIVANAGYYAAGIPVAPQADLSDGLFDVLILGDMDKLEMMQAIPMVYRGTHSKHPKVKMLRAANLSIESSNRILIQADGELVGEGPARFSILPSALSLAM